MSQTGVYYYNPHVDQGQQAGQPDNNSGKTRDIGIAFTVTQVNNSRLQDATWISTQASRRWSMQVPLAKSDQFLGRQL